MRYQRPIIIEIYAELVLEPGTLSFAQMLEVFPVRGSSTIRTLSSAGS